MGKGEESSPSHSPSSLASVQEATLHCQPSMKSGAKMVASRACFQEEYFYQILSGEIMKELKAKWKSACYSKPASNPWGSPFRDRLPNVTDKKKKKKITTKQELTGPTKTGVFKSSPHCTCRRTHRSSSHSEGAGAGWAARTAPGIRAQQLHFEDLGQDGLMAPAHPRRLVPLGDPSCSSHWRRASKTSLKCGLLKRLSSKNM